MGDCNVQYVVIAEGSEVTNCGSIPHGSMECRLFLINVIMHYLYVTFRNTCTVRSHMVTRHVAIAA